MAILLRPNPEAFNFLDVAGIARTEANGSIIIATCQLTSDLRQYGLWDKMKAIYPMVGGTSGSHKFNLKDPRDLDAAFRLTFSGSWIHSSTGATPDGSTAYADTKLNETNILSIGSTHLSYYSRTQVSGFQCEIGAEGPSNNNLDLFLYYSNISTKGYLDGAYTANYVSEANSNTVGFQIGSRTATNNQKLYWNNSLRATNTSTKSVQTNLNLHLGATNGNGTPYLFSTKQCAFSSIGDGLTDTEAANFYTAVQRFQTTLGRQV
jgi:hypothetical protein